MSEGSVPGASGRLLGVDNLQRAIDSTERIVGRLTTAVERSLPVLERGISGAANVRTGVRAGANWSSPTGSKAPNGGGASFGGTPVGSGGSTYEGSGKRRADGDAQIGGASWLNPGGGARRGEPARNGVATGGFIAGAAYSMGRSLNANIGHNVKQAADDSRLMVNFAQYYGMGSKRDYNSMFSGFNTAQNTQDLVAAGTQISLGGGAVAGSAKWRGLMQQAGTSAVSNPFMSLQDAAKHQTSLMTPTTYNSMRLVGIKTVEKGRVKSPIQIANEILGLVGLATKKLSIEEISYVLDDPMSKTNQTLSNWASHGVISPDQIGVVKENMRAILLARQKGVGATSLDKIMRASQGTGKEAKSAKEVLKGIGVSRTQLQGDKDLESSKRDAAIQRLGGFEKGLEKSTEALTEFHQVLNAITGMVPGLNFVTGFGRGMGENGKLGGALGMLNMVPGVSQAVSAATGLFGGGGGAVVSSAGIGSAGGALDMAGGAPSTGYVAGAGAVSGGGGGRTSAPGPTAGSNRTSGLYGGVKPHVARAGQEIAAKFSPASIGGVGPRSNASDHPKGLALDFMVYKDKKKGDGIANYVAANKARLSVTYIIWYKRIMRTGASSWSAYTHPNGPTSNATLNHMDHVHVSFSSKDSGHGGDPAVTGGSSSFGGATASGVGGGGKGSTSDFGPTTPASSSATSTASSSAGAGGSYSEAATISGALSGGASGGIGGSTSGAGLSGVSGVLGGLFGGGKGGSSSSAPSTTTKGGVTLVNPGKYTKDGITYFADANGNFSKEAQAAGAPASAGSTGSATGNRGIGQRMAAARGWTGGQWDSLLALWNAESGWRTDADNPSSSAYGIPQALIANRSMPKGYFDRKTGSGASTHAYGGKAGVQIQWGLDYIAGRYGNPSKAWAFHKKNNWYDKGAWDIQQDEDARVHKGEMVIPTNQARQIREVLMNNNPYGAGQGGGGVVLKFAPGSIVLSVGAGASPGSGRAIAKEFADALATDKRILALQNGRLSNG